MSKDRPSKVIHGINSKDHSPSTRSGRTATKRIDNELMVNHVLCPRKSYFQLLGCSKDQFHEFTSALRQRQQQVRDNVVNDYHHQGTQAIQFSLKMLTQKHPLLKDIKISYDGQTAFCDFLILSRSIKNNRSIFEPLSVLNSYKLRNEQKVELAYIANVLGSVQGYQAPFCHYVTLDNGLHKTPCCVQ